MHSRFEHFSYLIAGISRDIQRLERLEMEKYGYKGAFAQYLITLLRYEQGCTAAQLSEFCDKDKAAVSRVLAEMEKAGLVHRKNNPGLYNALILLTEEGQKAAMYVRRRASAAVAAVGSALSDDARKTMYDALEDISSRLQTVAKTGIPEE